MTVIEQTCPPFAVAVEPKRAQRLWELAVRSAAVITLTPRTDNELQLAGPIESATTESLWIACPEAAGEAELQSVCCDGELELGEARYLFDTDVLAIRSQQGRHLIEIARPLELHVIQRRRFWRAKVQGSSLVRLSRAGSEAGQQATGWSCVGLMLNASVDGLACRTECKLADAVAVGEALRVAFKVSEDEEPFAIDAIIKGKTPAATEGQVVLNLQFKHADDQQYQRLQATLECL
jgi:hypothetical protein